MSNRRNVQGRLIGKMGLIAACLCLITNPAKADPCEAALPKPGTKFGGIVRYVGDGDGLCVGMTTDPAEWIEVRLANFYAPELREPGGRTARIVLKQLVMGRFVRCVAGRRSYDRVVAACQLDSEELGSLMRQRGIDEGGRGRR